MGLFSKKIELVAPLTGELVDITEVEDITFSQKLLGDGVAIRPTSGELVAPCDAKVVQLFHTKHAIGLDVKGLEILIHVGMDTVELNGEGFKAHVSEGDSVKKGDLLLEIDFDYLKEKGYKTDTPIVITNMEVVKELQKEKGPVTKGETLVMEIKK